MRLVFFFLFFLSSQFAFCEPVKSSDFKTEFAEKNLTKYIVSGQSVIKFFNEEFTIIADPNILDGGFSAEYFDLEYEAHLRPNIPEPYIGLTEVTQDTNTLLKLHKKYYSKIKGQVALRNYFQTAFIGLLHTIGALKKVQVGLPAESYNVLTNLILEQGRLITSNQKEYVTMIDFWWDFIWAHFQNFPVDLIELGNQKLRGVWLNDKNDPYKKSIEKFLAGYSMMGLRKVTNPVVYRDITNQILVRLAKNAYEIYSLREDYPALTKARIFKYKYETKVGLTEEAERTKREIAKEGLSNRLKKVFTGPLDSLVNLDNKWLIVRIFKAIGALLFNFYSLTRYFVGFLLITFPFDAAFIAAGLIILSVEGRALFQNEFWPPFIYKPTNNKFNNFGNYLLQKINNFFARIINDLFFGFHMLFFYYTSDEANRNIRIGSSLLIFGLGLFFSSARTMVEAFVAQMSI